MPGRDSGGTYTSPVSPFITGTVISSTDVNARFAMLESEMTDSLSRSGKGGMLTALKLQDGSAAIPSLQYLEQPGIGLYRAGAYDLRFVMDAATKLQITNLGAAVTGTFSASGATTLSSTLSVGGTLAVTGGVTGNLTIGGTLGVTGAITGAAGAVLTNSTASGTGVAATGGSGFSVGVMGTGGPSDGWGLQGVGGGTNGIGVWGDGQGTGAAGYFKAGAGMSATVSRTAIVADRGDVAFLNTVNPNPDVAHTNTLCPMNVPKAWATIVVSAGPTVTLTAGFNISSVTLSAATTIDINFASTFANTEYVGVVTKGANNAFVPYLLRSLSTTTKAVLAQNDGAGVGQNIASGNVFYLVFFGAQ